MSRSPLLVLALVALYAGRAGAPPPLSGFPSEVRPLSSDAVPENARVWIFGKEPPPLAQLGASATVNGAPVGVSLRAEGCCLVVGELGADLATGDQVRVIVTHAGGDVELQLVPDAPADHVPPTLIEPFVLEELPGALVLGVEGDDDVALAGFLARSDEEVLGAAPPGFVLEVALGARRCAEIVAVDLAGNESAPHEVCTSLPDEDDGPSDDAGPSSDGGGEAPLDTPSCHCAAGRTGPSALSGLLPLALLARSARRNRS